MNFILANQTKELVNSCHIWHRWNVRAIVLWPLFLIIACIAHFLAPTSPAVWPISITTFLVFCVPYIWHLLTLMDCLYRIAKGSNTKLIINKTWILFAVCALHIVCFLFPFVFSFVFYKMFPKYLSELKADKSLQFDYRRINWKKIFFVDTIIDGFMCKDLMHNVSSTPTPKQTVPFPASSASQPTPPAAPADKPTPATESTPSKVDNTPAKATAPKAETTTTVKPAAKSKK